MHRYAIPLAVLAFFCAGGKGAIADDVGDFYRGKSITMLIAERSATDLAADFYRGKSVTLLVGVQEGSPYDLTARNAGSFLRRYIPGSPNVIPQNMPGASSGRATEYLYNVAPRDGTVVLVAAPYIVLTQALTPSVKYRAEEFSWLGRIAPLIQVGFVWHTLGTTSVEEAKGRQVIMGAAGPSGPSAMVPWALDRLTGTKFKVVRGYVGDTELFIAMQRGEIQGMGSVSLNALTERGWVAQKQVSILYAIANNRSATLPDVPTILEFADNERDRAVLRLLTSIPDIGVAIVAPPKVPPERIEALRQALLETVKDPEFIEAERKLEIDVDPLSGSEVEAIVSHIAGAPPDVIEALKAAIAPIN